MKRIVLLIISILLNFNTYSQVFKPNFLGEDFLLYKGVYFKLQEDATSGFNHAFYKDLANCQSHYDSNVIYPDSQYNFNTVKDSLANRIFKVENIIDKSGATFTGSSYLDKPIFVLKDTLNNQFIYYKYDSKYEHNFPFNTSKTVIDEKALCSRLERQIDEFTGEIKINSPMMNGSEISSLIVYKNINKVHTSYYLSLETHGSTAVVDGKGATILFTDGTKWTKPVKIDVDVDTKGFNYSAFISLTQTDIATLSNKKIKKFRLYIYDEEVSSNEADKFKAFLKCIKNIK
jgi:hypothetical protein